jgi:hypothetical protein
MQAQAATRKAQQDERPIIAFRLPAEEKKAAEEMAQRLDTNISTAARIIFRRGLQAAPDITV